MNGVTLNGNGISNYNGNGLKHHANGNGVVENENGSINGKSHVSSLFESNLNINAHSNKEFNYETIKEISDWLLERIDSRPQIAIVCGSGLGGLGERLTKKKIFPYKSIPNFPSSTVVGHKGNLIFGQLNNVDVVCMQGRFHAYEGYSNAVCTLPMKVFKLMNVKTVILTCAAGGINRSYNLGDIMMIKDHIALPAWTLQHPLVGENDERFGPRFPAANKLYTRRLRDLFRQTSKELNIDIQEGVYVAQGGPSYETVSELRAFQMMGADAAGMSTAQEAIVAGYCGMQVFALALITNITILDYDSDDAPNHEEVIDTANRRARDIEALVINFVSKI